MSITSDSLPDDSSRADAADARRGALRAELDRLDREESALQRQRLAAEHPDVVEDAADQAEDLVEQETIDALLEAVAFQRAKIESQLE